MFTRQELEKLNNGEVIDINGSRYGECDVCGNIVHLNKKFFGGAHFCLRDEDIRIKQKESEQ